MRTLGEQEIRDIAIGSALLGTGGGGDPYLGKLAALQSVQRHGPLELTTIDELDNDTLVVFPFAIGSPVPLLERLTMTDEIMQAQKAMSKYFGQPIGAVMPIEIGGVNSVIPLAVGRELGLPVIDGDCMGRAYPEIQLATLTLYGHSAAPLAVGDEHGNVAVLDTVDNFWAERLARPVAIEMGAISGGVGFPVSVRDLKEAAILGTVSWAEDIGRSIRQASAKREDPVQAALRSTGGFELFRGRIVDVDRRTEKGWARGETRIAGIGDYANREMAVRFQNEHLVAVEDDEIVASVPDLIAILDSERGDPITTENLRYGFRVTVIGIPSDEKWRTAAGVELGGPRHFGYDIDFVPVEQRFGPSAA